MSEFSPALESALSHLTEVDEQVGNKLEQLSKDFIESHDELSEQFSNARREFDHVMHRMDNIEKPPKLTPDELYKALALAQGEIQAAEARSEAEVRKKETNKFLYSYKYADLAACLEVIRKPLADNGLCLIQIPSFNEEGLVTLETILGHESGQSISCTMSMRPEKSGPQAIGTCITYLRRYSLSAMIGVAQFDDDAASATKGPDEYDRLTPRDIDEILVKADELFGDDADAVLDEMRQSVFPDKHHLADIPADQLKSVLRRLANAKKTRDKKTADAKKSPVAEPKKKGGVTQSQADEQTTNREPGEDDE